MSVKIRFLWIFKLCVFTHFIKQRGFVGGQTILSPSTAVVSENNSVTLTCTYSGDGTVTYFTWSVSKISENKVDNVGIISAECKPFIALPINTSLYEYACPDRKQYTWTIKKVTRQEDGDKYRCNVDTVGSGNINSNNASLSVQIPITSVSMIVPSTSSVTVNENTEEEFKCRTSGGLPAASVRWYKDSGTSGDSSDDLEITSGIASTSSTVTKLTVVTSTLRYSPSRNENGWRIYCIASNVLDQTPLVSGRKPSLNVRYPPMIGQLQNTSVAEGSPVTVSCPVTVGNPPQTTYQWLRNGQVWKSSQSFTIDTTSRTDAMFYTCKVFNSMVQTGEQPTQQPHSKSLYLNVWYSASITEFYITGHIGETRIVKNENDPVAFNCNVDSNPGSDISVYYQENVLKSQSATKSLFYSIVSATCTNRGEYRCVGFNDYNQYHASNLLSLFVNCSPRPSPYVTLKENVTSAKNKQAVLTFTTLAYPEPNKADFKWYRFNSNVWQLLSNSGDFQIETSNLQANLTIKDVNRTFYGIYKLEIKNDIGYWNQTFYLEPEDVPDPPEEFRYVTELVTKSSITLQWKPGFDYGTDQTFILRYKRVSDKDWSSVSIPDTGEDMMNYTIKKLFSGTEYAVVLHALNKLGNSSKTDTLRVDTKGLPEICSRMESENAAVITGICLGLVVAVLAIYSTSITILYKRKTTSKDQRLVVRESTQKTYVNVAYKPNVPESQSNDGATEAESNDAQQYTDLVGYSRDDRTTYEVLHDL